MKKIIRVFPRKTNATPMDDMVRFGDPGMFDKGGLIAFIKNGVTYSFNTPKNVIEFWRLTGNLVINPSKPQVVLLTEKGNIEIQKINNYDNKKD